MQGCASRVPALPAKIRYKFKGIFKGISYRKFKGIFYRKYREEKDYNDQGWFNAPAFIDMMKRLGLIFMIFALLSPIFAATLEHKDGKKQMKTIKEQLKAGKAADALKAAETLRKDSVYMWNAQLLQYAVDASRMLNDKENEKFYLNTKADTTALFNTTYNLVNYILLTDSAERMANLRLLGEVKPVSKDSAKVQQSSTQGRTFEKYRFRKTNREVLNRIYRNVIAAPRYFSARGKWEETIKFSGIAIDLMASPIWDAARSPIGGTSASNSNENLLRELSVLNVNTCYKLHKFDDIEKYAEYALADTLNSESISEKLAYCALERGDTLVYNVRLQEGHSRYPANMFYFGRLVDAYLHHGDNSDVERVANATLQYIFRALHDEAQVSTEDSVAAIVRNPEVLQRIHAGSSQTLTLEDIAYIYEARAIAHHNSGNPRLCIEDAENILKCSPDHPRANYFIGISYYVIAESVAIPALMSDPKYRQAVNERNRLYTLARPYLEAYRRNAPADADSWAPMLYQVYLNLNLGPEFEEISKYLK